MPAKLNIIRPSETPKKQLLSKNNRVDLVHKKLFFENLWTQSAELQLENKAIERLRIDRSWSLLSRKKLKGLEAVDLGCGQGALSIKFINAGAIVTGLDIAGNALKYLYENFAFSKLIQSALPKTKLEDDSFDIVICTDVIAYIDQKEHRLFFSELSRIVKASGVVLCSTRIDFRTDDPVEIFLTLASSEFAIDDIVFSFHAYSIRIIRALMACENFISSAKDPSLREAGLSKRQGLRKLWFRLNSHFLAGFFWRFISLASLPAAKALENNLFFIKSCEWLTKALSGRKGISHVIFTGWRKGL